MTGVAKSFDKLEEKVYAQNDKTLRKYGQGDPLAGELKHEYAEHRGVDDMSEGYLAGKEKKQMKEAEAAAAAAQAKADADAKAKSVAELATATEKSHAAQKEALKRKGRRASILTSAQGTDQLGVPG